VTRAVIAIALLFPTLAWAQTGYGLRLCNRHIAAIVDCRCAGPLFEREFSERRLDNLLRLRALQFEHGAEMMHVWMQRMRAADIERSLQRLDVVAADACAAAR
jgi:hypothetical protein